VGDAVDDEGDVTDLKAGPVYFRHDGKLVLPTPTSFTNDQMESFIQAIEIKTLVITAENGWPVQNVDDHIRYLKILNSKGLLTSLKLPGSHHLHLDPGYAAITADVIATHLLEAPVSRL
jgi:hypothetical protein